MEQIEYYRQEIETINDHYCHGKIDLGNALDEIRTQYRARTDQFNYKIEVREILID